MATTNFGNYFKELRIKTGLTLRAFCQEHGYDAGNLSKLERGLLPPPHGEEKLTEYAKSLGVRPGSDEWYEFFDRAAAARGELPKSLLSDDEVLEKLPLLFRTLRGKPVSAEKLRELIETIRRN
jgi:transcriptional regulator with XRE-family HTH domain